MTAQFRQSRWVLAAAALIIVALAVVLLVVGRTILVPFAIALVIWFLLNAISRAIEGIGIGGRHLPGIVALALSFVLALVVMVFVAEMVGSNLAAIAQAAPRYQANLEQMLPRALAALGIDQTPEFGGLAKQIDVQRFLLRLVNTLGNVAASTGLIVVYVIFLLVEQRIFPLKLRALFPDPARAGRVRQVFDKVRNDVLTYVWIKFLTSLLTGALSFAVMSVVGLDNAIFWAFLIFLLNFIPTIGSLLATVFPTVIALMQFGELWPVLAMLAALTTIQVSVGNLLEPRLMGRSLNLSPLVVMVSLLLWGAIWGIVGAFLSVPLTVITMIVCAQFPQTRPVAVLLSSDGRIDGITAAEDG